MWSKIRASSLTLWHKNTLTRILRLLSIPIWQAKPEKSIDEAKAYVNTMSASELWDYFCKTEDFTLKDGKAIEGFMPDWIGEFYAYYQWYYNLPSSEVVKKSAGCFSWKKTYGGLHDLELDLAVQKVGEV